VIGTQFVAYLGLDSLDDANKAIAVLEKAGGRGTQTEE